MGYGSSEWCRTYTAQVPVPVTKRLLTFGAAVSSGVVHPLGIVRIFTLCCFSRLSSNGGWGLMIKKGCGRVWGGGGYYLHTLNQSSEFS
jgi:hypothetical protein